MKDKFSYKGFYLGLLVLIAILLQSAHSFVHLAETLREPHCQHDYAKGKNTFNHDHHSDETCFACSHAFTTPTGSLHHYVTIAAVDNYAIVPGKYCDAAPLTFCGSLFALRGPPSIV